MQSHGVTFLSANSTPTPTDVLETKAITEFERDRKRAFKGHDIRKKVTGITGHHHHVTNGINASTKLPARRRGGGGEEKERRVLGRLGWDLREEADQQWIEEWVADDEEDMVIGKENRPSPAQSALVVRLEDLVVKSPAAKGGKKLLSPLTSRPATPRQLSRATTPFFIADDDVLLSPLMDTSDSDDDDDSDDDGLGFFEFSSPGAADWTVVVTEDGCLEYSTSSNCGFVASASSTTTVVVMPCAW